MIGAVYAYFDLNLDSHEIIGLPIALGGGRVKTAHGILPVPAPAVVEILKGANCLGGPVDSELATPTGSAIYMEFCNTLEEFLPSISPLAIGYGAGMKDFDFPNVLRIIKTEDVGEGDQVDVIETNIDHLTGEEILASRPEKSSSSDKQLTEEEQKQIDELKARDREVKTHEQAHIAAGGSYVKGGATYDYQTGPDGKQYAVGGSVNIDTSPVDGDPEATIAKAQVVIKAALAPAEPSGQDQKVASAARQMMNEARKELTSQNNAEINADTNTDTENTTGSVEESSDTSNKETAAVNTDSSTSSANTNISSKESAGKANNTDNTSNTAATQAPVQNLRESNVTSIQQKNNQNITAASYNIGSLISLTA